MSLGFLRPEWVEGDNSDRIIIIDTRHPAKPLVDLTPAQMVQLASQALELCAQAFAERDTARVLVESDKPIDYYATDRPAPASSTRRCRARRGVYTGRQDV